jgi:redox-sensing transcriptional repressor
MARREKESSPAIPKAAAGRLSLYLRYLESLLGRGVTTTSSQQLADGLGVTAAQVRKDLGYFGQFGYPGVGYRIDQLTAAIRGILGTDRTWKVAIVGIGNLGSALVQYRGFERQGFRICALFDNHPKVIGKRFGTLEVRSVAQVERVVREGGIELGIIAVPAERAQEVADLLVAAGIRGIFNFAPTVLDLPPGVGYVSIDLAVELEQLSFIVTQSAS